MSVYVFLTPGRSIACTGTGCCSTAVEITFNTPKLKKLCESQHALQRAHGQQCARKLQARLDDLQAAAALDAMRDLPGKCHELSGDRDGQLTVLLAGGKRLIFEPATDPVPTKDDGGLDWEYVDAIRVLELVDYHDD